MCFVCFVKNMCVCRCGGETDRQHAFVLTDRQHACICVHACACVCVVCLTVYVLWDKHVFDPYE